MKNEGCVKSTEANNDSVMKCVQMSFIFKIIPLEDEPILLLVIQCLDRIIEQDLIMLVNRVINSMTSSSLRYMFPVKCCLFYVREQMMETNH